MSAPQQTAIRNQILAGLRPEDFAALQVYLEPVELETRRAPSMGGACLLARW